MSHTDVYALALSGMIGIELDDKRFGLDLAVNETSGSLRDFLVVRAAANGENPADAFLFLARLGSDLYHSERSGRSVRSQWQGSFGHPRPEPFPYAHFSGHVLLRLSKGVWVSEITRESRFSGMLLRAIEHGKDPAVALAFLATLGAVLFDPENIMVKSIYRTLWNKYFRTSDE